LKELSKKYEVLPFRHQFFELEHVTWVSGWSEDKMSAIIGLNSDLLGLGHVVYSYED